MPSVRQSNLGCSTASRTSRQPLTRLENVRTGLQQLFTGRSSVGLARSSSPESPKSPQYTLGLQNLSSSRINIPHLTRTTTIPNSSNESPGATFPVSAPSPTTPISTRPITPNSLRQQIQHTDISINPSQGRHDSARRFVGIDPAEEHLAELAEHGRRRRRRNKSRTSYRRCAPKIKNRKIRSKTLSCFISGLVCVYVLVNETLRFNR